MARDWAKRFYDSKAWKDCRESFIRIRESEDGGLCQICRRSPGLIVHHRTWLTPLNVSDPDVSLNHANMLYVCQQCHNGITSENEKILYFDDDGQPVEL